MHFKNLLHWKHITSCYLFYSTVCKPLQNCRGGAWIFTTSPSLIIDFSSGQTLSSSLSLFFFHWQSLTWSQLNAFNFSCLVVCFMYRQHINSSWTINSEVLALSFGIDHPSVNLLRPLILHFKNTDVGIIIINHQSASSIMYHPSVINHPSIINQSPPPPSSSLLLRRTTWTVEEKEN